MILRRLFGRKPTADPAADANTLTLRALQGDWQCSCCGEQFHGIMDIAADHPDPWPHGAGYEPNSALRLDGDFLSEDFCVLHGEHFLVRCVMEFPVHGLGTPWVFGCWSSLSRENFDKYVDGFDSGEYGDGGPWFGWLCNGLKPAFVFDHPVPVDVCPRPGRQRPNLFVTDEVNPMAIAQREGVSAEELLAILRANGHGPTVQ
jgi:hypothetical protein